MHYRVRQHHPRRDETVGSPRRLLSEARGEGATCAGTADEHPIRIGLELSGVVAYPRPGGLAVIKGRRIAGGVWCLLRAASPESGHKR
jgi:hypothetical protein